MDHIFIIQSSVEGHLGSFHSLAIVDIAALNNYPTFATTWTGLEIMLSEISQAEKDNYHMVSLIYGT